jgi:Tc toxin complex TcA C-terminal TcB-binding domain
MDFPGHYFRRIKSTAMTVPYIVGPYTGVNYTLRLLKHRYRCDAPATGGKDYVEKMEGKLDVRFRTDNVSIEAVAVSTGQNDSGVFEMQLHDERYLPFEGAGVVSSWLLQMPSLFRPFDYSPISDVILTMRYTSCEGGDVLRKAAAGTVAEYISTVEGYSPLARPAHAF